MKIVMLLILALLMSHEAIAQNKNSCARAEHVFVRSTPSPDTRPIKLDVGTIHVDRIPIATSADLIEVSADPNDRSTVRLKYGATAADRLTRATTNNAGARLAFLLDDEVLLLVTWQGEFGFTASGVQLSFGRASVGERVLKALEPCVGHAEMAVLFKGDQARFRRA
jgi:preprotein translocase subunit SecD